MKKFFAIIACAAALLTFVPMDDCKAASSDTPYLTGTNTLSTNSVAASTTATVTSSPVRLRGNQGVAFFPDFTGVGADTGNVTFSFAGSTDSNTWTTVTPWTYTVAAVNSNAVRGVVNFDRGQSTSLNNIKWIRLQSVVNANTNAITLNRLRWSMFDP